MSLIRRSAPETTWGEWFPARNLFDWSTAFPQMFDDDRLRVEEYRDDGTLVIRAEMPGIEPEKDVEITVVEGMLTISAERTEKSETEDKSGYRSEFRYGSFSRTLPLPAGATEDDIVANYTDGILEVRVPIGGAEPEKKKIPVDRN